MNMKLCGILACVVALAGVGSVRAADGKRPGAVNLAQLYLDHADDLGLTAEQKAKLEEMAKAPTPQSVLTPEQRKKVRELLTKAVASKLAKKDDAPPAADDKKTDAKPADDKKTDEKKPDDKKPDEKKPDPDTK